MSLFGGFGVGLLSAEPAANKVITEAECTARSTQKILLLTPFTAHDPRDSSKAGHTGIVLTIEGIGKTPHLRNSLETPPFSALGQAFLTELSKNYRATAAWQVSYERKPFVIKR
jgi:hypothetical protein